MMGKIEFINIDKEKEFGVTVDYLKLRCACGNTWGVGFFGKEQTIDPKDLLCSHCALEEKASNMK